MREVDSNCRIQNKDVLSRFLAKTYQKGVADQIATFFFKNYFGEYNAVKIEDYYRGIQAFVNSDHREWQRLRFSIFDLKAEGKINEVSLFEFVKATSLRPLTLPAEPTQLL
jgi:hypothetical protein